MSGMEAEIQGFSISRAWRDKRLRSVIVQILVLAGLFLFFAYIVNNAIQNLAALDKSFGFGFLQEPASYDINQRLLEYTSRDSHLRAALMGLLNTLVVAVLGCITATVLGVIIGVLRLSSNWLVARLMTVYVELFRNVPVLLWIVFVMAILIETLPAPRAFRGENPEATMSLADSVAVTNRGVYIPEPLFSRSLGDIHLFGDHALRFDVSLDLIAILAVLGLSLFGMRKVAAWANATQEKTGDPH